MTKTVLAGLLAAASLTAAAEDLFYVVVPVPNKLVSRTAIDVALAGYALPAALIGTPYEGFNLNHLLSVTGDPGYTGYGVRWELVSGSLPAGLSFGKDGAITGTPTAAGTASFQVRATYKTKSGQQAYQLVVANLTVGLATGTPPQALVGQGYSYDLKPRLTVSGDSAYAGAGVTWSVVDSTLPAGLYLTADGFIGGTPTAAGSGSLTARASYKGVNGEQTYQVVSLKVAVGLATGTPPQALVGRAYSYDLKSRLSVTGDPGFDGSGVTWSVVDSTLPAGLYLTADGFIGGTPTAAGTGTVTVLATYKNAQGEQAYQVVSLDIQVALASATPPEAYVGQGYSYDLKPLLTVSGDSAYTGAGVTWSVVDSTLPAGLYLTADGFIGGTPTAAGTGTVTVRAAYKNAQDEQAYQVVTVAITVSLSAAPIPEAKIGAVYGGFDFKNQVYVTGDAGFSVNDVSFSATGLPPGLNLSSSGLLTGTPTQKNSLGAAFQVTASYKSATGQQVYNIVVNGSPMAVTQISLGPFHSCALTTAGGVKCWGFNGNGNLGEGSTTNRADPVDVVGLTSGVTSIATGWQQTCALTSTQGVKCWGENSNGALGDGTTVNRSTPVTVSGLSSGVASLGLGYYHSCVVKTNGGAYCWGANGNGQLGNGSQGMPVTTPVAVSGLSSGVASLVGGESHTCARTTAGAVKCWGYNQYGQMGTGSLAPTNQLTPVSVAGMSSGVASLAAGGHHNCAIVSGALKCWGYNDSGQLGNNSTVNSATPIAVPALTSNVAQVSLGSRYGCVRMNSGGMKCWGSNYYGQLGDGTTTASYVPRDVPGLTAGVSSISAGRFSSCALVSGYAKCAGVNHYGQLGSHGITHQSVHVYVEGP